MRLKPLVAVVAAAFLLTACDKQAADKPAQQDAAATTELATQEQKLSYIFGQNIGGQFKADDVAIDVDVFAQGVRDALAGSEPLMGEEEIIAALEQFQTERMAEQQAEADAMAAENKAEGDAFMAENAAKEGVVTLDSGLQYKVITEGEGPIPTQDSTVEVHYRGTLIDGTEFDSSHKRGEPASFGVTQVIPGWTEALTLMKEGAKWELYIPPSLAYGPGGAGGVIGPEQTLIFEVELLKADASVDADEEGAEEAGAEEETDAEE